jgi:signal peptide peptidase SppA
VLCHPRATPLTFEGLALAPAASIPTSIRINGRLADVPKFLNRVLPKSMRSEGITIPVIRLQGAIFSTSSQLRPFLSLASTAGLIEKAFAFKEAPAVAISINSPGGSPVQSRLIYKRIRDMADEKGKQVLVFVEDIAASGGYMIALAGDEIIADPSSIVGSIGVVSASFGFQDLIKKIGVERRVHTAGQNKAVLDPFRPEKPEDVERLKALQLEVHETFIDLVKERRGKRLADDPDLFTGLFWSAKRGVALGLVDSLGDMRSVLKARYGDKTKLKLVTQPRGFLARRLGFLGSAHGDLSPDIAAGAVSGVLDVLAERALWSRFGL